MGEVVKLKRPRKGTIRGAARSMLTEALDSVGAAHAVVIVTIGVDGRFAVRSANYDSIQDFDMYARAGSVIDRRLRALVDD